MISSVPRRRRGGRRSRSWRSTSAGPSWRSASSTGTGSWAGPSQAPHPGGRSRDHLGRPRGAASGPCRRSGRWRAGSDRADPCRPGASWSPRSTFPGWRDFPLRARVAELTGLPTWIDNDAKAWPWPTGGWAKPPGCATTSRWSCPPASAAASSSTAGCSTGTTATPGTSATWSSSRPAGAAPAEGRAAWRRRRPAPPSRPSPAEPPAEAGPEVVARDRHAGRPGRGVGGQPARPAAGLGQRLGGARLRRAVLRGRPAGAGGPGPPAVLARLPHRRRPARGRPVR